MTTTRLSLLFTVVATFTALFLSIDLSSFPSLLSTWWPFHSSARNFTNGLHYADFHSGPDSYVNSHYDHLFMRHSFLEMRHLNGSRLVIVDQQGFGHFRTIQAAIDSVPANNTRPYTILVSSGVFLEKVTIPHTKPFVTLQGLGCDDTIISWHDTASTFSSAANPDSHERSLLKPLGTLRSATVAVNAPNFIARDITFQNTAPAPDGGMSGRQAVALQVSGDRVAFYDCKFLGAQDTLYDHKGRHFFKSCYIEGSIDFIFGNGLSLYQDCEIHATGSGFITAQKRQNASEETGFSFVNCRVTGKGVRVYLGRAWGAFSRVVYVATYMDDIVMPEGWDNWEDNKRQRTVFYGEYNCSGPGANSQNRVPWSAQLNETEVQKFMNSSFIKGEQWLLYEI